MKNIKFTVIVTLFSIARAITCVAQGDAMSYRAYTTTSPTIWEQKIASTSENTFARAMAQYGFLNSTMASKDDEAFHRYYDETIDLLDELIEAEKNIAECMALKSSIYGLELAYNSYKGMFLGPKSTSLIEDAYEMENGNPLVVKLYASSKLYTPEIFGGDPDLAVKEFDRCIKLYEEKGDTTNNWFYLDALAHLGLAYQKVDNHDMALTVFNKALKMEPDFGWIKYALKPSSEKALAAK